MRHLAAVLLLLAAAAHGQDAPAAPPPAPALPARFAGWDGLRDPAFKFDPDERDVMGFSVHATPLARAALEAAESALAAGDSKAAARRFADMIGKYGDEVLQVQADHPRWVGAGEWALYELLTRVPDSAREALASADDDRDVASAAHWRDLPRLRRLAAELDGRAAGRQAAATLARLLAERGEATAARATAARASEEGVGAHLSALASLAARLPAEHAPGAPGLQLPETLEVRWRNTLVINSLGKRNPFLASPMSGSGEAPIAPIAPAVADGAAYVTDSLSVRALDVLSGRVLWHHAGPLERVEEEDEERTRFFSFNIYVDDWRMKAVSPYQCLTPALTDAMVVTTEQVAEPWRELHNFEGIPIDWPLPRRRLVALDRASGEVLWRQEKPGAGPDDFCNAFDVAGPPAIGGGAVYAAGSITEGAISSYVAAFDEHTGALLWKTLLCSGQQDLTMFNRPFKEHTASPPLLQDGLLYVVTNLGVVASLDGFSGRVRWLAAYDSVQRRASRSPERDVSRDVAFVNRPPCIEAGRLIIAPLDATHVTALDPQTGRQVWLIDAVQRSNARGARHDVLPSGDGRLLVTGERSVECFDAATGALQWTSLLGLDRDDEIVGAATLAEKRLLLPTLTALIALDIDSPANAVHRAWEGAATERGVRRVVAAGPALLMTDNAEVFGAVDVDRALEQAQSGAGSSPAAQLQVAELLLAKERCAEAAERFEAVLASGDPGLLARARSGRLQAATVAARTRDDAAGWQELLDVAARLGDPWPVASEAVRALSALGADAAVDGALADLAARQADHLLDLGPLTPDGEQPVGLVLALRRAPHEAPAAAVALLQGLIERWPDQRWNGEPVRQACSRRIAELISEHGREVYAPFDRQAEEVVPTAQDPTGLATVEARFPNARVLSAVNAVRLRAALDAGLAREAFEQLSRMAVAGTDRELTALRVQAARNLGETGFADALQGGALPAGPSRALPALPGGDAERQTLEISARVNMIRFPTLNGRFDPPLDRCTFGAINGPPGELFLLDTATGQLRWRRPIPGGRTFASPGAVDFLTDGKRLFVQVYGQRTASSELPQDLIECLALSDGTTLWSTTVPGPARSSAVAGGLLLRLCGGGTGDGRHFRVDGYGAASGAVALSTDLPPSVNARLFVAGPHVVVSSDGDLLREGVSATSRLAVLDVLRGTLAGGAPLLGEAPTVVLANDDPPLLMLSRRSGLTGTGPAPAGGGASLIAWDPARRQPLWEAGGLASVVQRAALYPAGQGRLLLSTLEPGAPGQGGLTVLTPIDVRKGPLPPTRTGATLSIVSGQDKGLVPRLVFVDSGDPTRLLVADAATSELRYEVRLPAPLSSTGARVLHGRDGFLLVHEPPYREDPSATLRVFDAATGSERYSTVVSGLAGSGHPEVTLAEGAVVLASRGTVTIVRSAAR